MAGTFIALVSQVHAAPADPNKPKAASEKKINEVESIIAGWPEMAQLGIRQTMQKHGSPSQMTADELVWTDVGPYKSITVTKQMNHHDFPLPHMDYMEHTISYLVPAEKANELAAFDGSLTYDRTRGLMSARCDLEAHNVLTLNLAHDIIEGKKTAAEAREAFGKIVAEDNAGKNPAYTTKLQFEPVKGANYTDFATIPGAPARDKETEDAAESGSDAVILAHIIAVDQNVIVASKSARLKELPEPVKEFTETLQKHHAMNAGATMQLATKLDIQPVITEEIAKSRMKAAGEMAELLKMDDGDFPHAFMSTVVQDHQKVLDMIDNKLMENAKNEELKKHLAETRVTVAKHLENAKEIKSSLNSGDKQANAADE